MTAHKISSGGKKKAAGSGRKTGKNFLIAACLTGEKAAGRRRPPLPPGAGTAKADALAVRAAGPQGGSPDGAAAPLRSAQYPRPAAGGESSRGREQQGERSGRGGAERQGGCGASDGGESACGAGPAGKAGCAMPSRGKENFGTTERLLGSASWGEAPWRERPLEGAPLGGSAPWREPPWGGRPLGERLLGGLLGGSPLGGSPLGGSASWRERPLEGAPLGGSAPWGEAPWGAPLGGRPLGGSASWRERPGEGGPWGEAPWGSPLQGAKEGVPVRGEASPPTGTRGCVRQGGAGAARQERSVTPYLFLRVSSAWSSSSAARASVRVASRSRSTSA